MSYTYPEALDALQRVASDYLRIMRPNVSVPCYVICNGHAVTACVSWDAYSVRIELPVRPASSRMTEDEFQDWIAYVLHEMGHPTHTDKATWEDACRKGLGNLTNATEDVRMEQAIIVSGIAPNARKVLSRLISRKIAEARAKGWNPNARKSIAWTLCVLGRAANGYDLEQSDLDWINSQIIPGSTVHGVLAWALPELARCSNTADCLALSERIAKAIGKPADAPNGKSGGGQPETGKTSQQGPQGQETPSEEQGEGEGEGGRGGKGAGAPEDEKPVTDNELDSADIAPRSNDRIENAEQARIEAGAIEVIREALRGDKKPRNAGAAERGQHSGTERRLRDAAAKASKQRALLSRTLRANEQEDRESGRRSGRLDRGALARAAIGSPNVFAKHDISEGFDTDVCVLLDASGSMGGESMYCAAEVGLVIAQAAAMVGVSCTVEAFNGHGFIRAGKLAGKRCPDIAEFARVARSASNSTPLSPSIARAASEQAQRAPGKRKVVFVVTDGGCDHGLATLKRTVEYVEQSFGTVLAHVSIYAPLRGAFRAEARVDHGKSIAETGLAHFVKVLQNL